MARLACPSCPRQFQKMKTLKEHFRRAHDPLRGAKKVSKSELVGRR